jgi:hypothetical protein
MYNLQDKVNAKTEIFSFQLKKEYSLDFFLLLYFSLRKKSRTMGLDYHAQHESKKKGIIN